MHSLRSLLSLLTSALCLLWGSAGAHATTFNCERTTHDSSGFVDDGAFNSWFPVSKEFDGTKFKDVGAGSQAMLWIRIASSSKGRSVEQRYRLLPNKVLISNFKPFGNYKSVDNIRYKCEISSNELRARLASQPKSSLNKNQSATENARKTKCFSGDPDSCNNEELCSRATRLNNGSRRWETGSEWAPYVLEANSRSLKCDVIKESTVALPENIPNDFDQFRKVTIKLSNGDFQTLGAGKIEQTSKGFSTQGRLILNGQLCASESFYETSLKEGSFNIKCPDGYLIEGGYIPLGTGNGSLGKGYDSEGKPVEYRVHSNSGSNYVSRESFVEFYNEAFKTTSSSLSKLDKAKLTCAELGFKAGTEKYGECVLKIKDDLAP